MGDCQHIMSINIYEMYISNSHAKYFIIYNYIKIVQS